MCKRALIDLGLLPIIFSLPQSGLEEAGDALLAQDDKRCECQVQQGPPEPPMELPMPAIKENIPLLKEWIVKRYASSAFNVCMHQRLPLVDSSPLFSLLVDLKVKPTVVHHPAQVPIHFRDEILEG